MSPGRIIEDKDKDKVADKNPFEVLARSPSSENIISVLPAVPITTERKPFRQPADDIRLPELGVARANVAATYEKPTGSQEGAYSQFAEDHKHQTVLQQHLAFFDTDGDNIIWPIDTFWGFMRLGFGLVLSIVAVFIIHPPFSVSTTLSLH